MKALSKLRVRGLGKDPDRLLRLHPEQIRLQAVIQRDCNSAVTLFCTPPQWWRP